MTDPLRHNHDLARQLRARRLSKGLLTKVEADA